LAFHLSRINPLPVWTNFSDSNLLPLLWLIDCGAPISDSMTIPCYDRRAINFLEEANNCFQSDIDLKSDKVNCIFYYLKLFYVFNLYCFIYFLV
jgi:hypothetical protein